MKIEIERSGTIAWSPSGQFPNLIASGTVAGSLDVDFDTSAHLEIFQVDFSKGEMNVVGRASANDRFNRICWGQTGIQNGIYPKGLLAGGLNNGTVNIWDASKIIGNMNESETEESALIASCERHASGQSVQGLDFNPYQYNLLASGGSDSEIFIWDLQNPQNPTVYNPGAKQQVYQDSGITCLQWNRKVQHILGSVNYSGVTVVWDLKAKKAVLNFSSPNRKLRCKAFAWNPDEATQIITASEDDGAPILELWDLRNTYSPAKTFEGHTRGIWSVSWCPMDSDLLLTCGKDNRTLCWNVKTGEILSEVEHNSSTWNFDVQWSPKIPAILSTCSLERKITLHSLQDVRGSTDKSFAVQGTQQKLATSHAPKWLKRPVGVSFGFGGKIVWFKRQKPTDTKSVQVTASCEFSLKFQITQVVTDKEFLGRADHLQEALAQNDLKKYCDEKIQQSQNEEEKSAWSLMRLLFEQTPRNQLLQYLGFNPDKISEEIKEYVSKLPGGGLLKEEEKVEEQVEEKKEVEEEKKDENSDEFFDNIASKPEQPPKQQQQKEEVQQVPFEFVSEGAEGMITKALIVGNFEAAVETCIRSDRMADALILAAYGGTELWKKTQEAYFNQKPKPFMRIVSSIIKDQLRVAVEQADLKQWKTVVAVICTYAKREEFAVLCSLVGDRLLHESKNVKAATEAYICAGNIDKLLQIWEQESSQENSLQSLQDLIEKISVFRKLLNHQQPLQETIARKFSEYAQLLAGQGKLESAAHCLSFLTEAKYEDTTTFPFILLDRLYHASKGRAIATSPPFPFQKQEVSGQVMTRPAPTAAPATKTTVPPPATTAFPGTSAPFPGTGPTTATSPFPGTSTAPFPGPSHGAPTPFPSGPTTPRGTSTAPFPGTGPSPFPAPSTTAPAPFPSKTTAPFPGTGPSPFPSATTTTTPFPAPATTASPPFPGSSHTAPFPGTTAPFPSATTAFPPPATTTSPFPAPANKPAFPGGNVGTTPSGPPPMIPTTATTTSAAPAPSPKVEAKATGPVTTSAENSALIQLLNQILQQISASTDPKVSKYAKDVVKRFEPMTAQLAKNEFSKDITLNMTNLCHAILAGDSRGAQDIHVKITQQHWEELGSNIMIGLKRLVDITKA